MLGAGAVGRNKTTTLLCSRVVAVVWRAFVAKTISELHQRGMVAFAKPCDTRTYVTEMAQRRQGKRDCCVVHSSSP